MTAGVRFRLGGVPVLVEPFFFVGMGLLGWAMGRRDVLLLEWLVVAGASILLHEMGHAVAFRRFGSNAEVVVGGFGGYTTGSAQPPARSAAVSVAGPAVGLVVGLVVLAYQRTGPPSSVIVAAVTSDLIFVNLGWGIFNLLPMLPLDGGSIVQAGLDGLTHGDGERIARIISVVTATAVAGVALLAGQQFAVLLVAYFGAQNLQALTAGRNRPHLQELHRARQRFLAGDEVAATEIAARVESAATSSTVRVAAGEILAWAALSAGDPAQAEASLAQAGGGVGASQLVRAMVARSLGRLPPPSPAPGFAACRDDLAAAVAAGMLSRSGEIDEVMAELGRLPVEQAESGRRALQIGLGIALGDGSGEP